MIGSVNVPGASAADLARVKQIANDAATDAGKAKSDASDAKSTAEEAKTAASNVQTAVSEAITAASNAATAATDAKTAADEAVSAASSAQAVANEAKAMAENAADAAEKASENAGRCAIKITFDAGFVGKGYTVTDGDDEAYTGVVPEGLVVTVNVEDCNTVYTVSAEADNGVNYTSNVTTGPYYGQYTASLTVFTADIIVTTVAGATVTVVGEGDTYRGTAGSDGTATIQAKKSGNYTVQAQYSGANSNAATVEATTNGGSYNAAVRFMTLEITIDSGSTVTVSDGSTTLSGTSTGTVKFYLPNAGTWSVTAELNDETTSGSVTCSDYTDYVLELSYVKIFGVCWNYGATSTALTRLTKNGDPNELANVDIATEPSAALGTGSGSSPFDNYLPWSGMEEYNIVNNAVSYKYGESGFSRSSYDTVVFVPEYYFKIVDDPTNSKRYFYIADKAKAGFTKHPGSGKYVGRYNTISGYYSKSGSSPLVNITRPTARTKSKAKGDNWNQYDYATWCAVWLLYLVEFADWNSQSTIGLGICGGLSSAQATGKTDTMNYHTGTISTARSTAGAVQYRNIENPWGNVWEWIDGVNFSNGAVYVCTEPSKYTDDTATNYTNIGTKVQNDGYVSAIGVSDAAPWAFFPTAVGGSETTYIPDRANYNTGWCVLNVGGSYNNTAGYAGLFYFNANNSSSNSNSNIGARLLV